MDIIKIMLDNGEIKELNGIFYLYNSKYYVIYTEKELDENGYVILYLVQVGKEVKNTPEGPVDTGYMIGMEISNEEDWKKVQESITKIVEDKKDSKQSPKIQYLPINMLNTLKIKSKKKFRLMKDLVQNYFGLDVIVAEEIVPTTIEDQVVSGLDIGNQNDNLINIYNSTEIVQSPLVEATSDLENTNGISNSQTISDINPSTNDFEERETIIDYRTRFFEEQEKNKNLELKISELEEKIEGIKKLINM